MKDMARAVEEIGRLRNRHVAKLLSYLGDAPPYLETAIKKSLTMFAEDVERNIIRQPPAGNNSEGESDEASTNQQE